jgi:hypothetical protein
MLHAAAREHNVIEFGEAPLDRAKTPVMKSVRLKDSLLDIWLKNAIIFRGKIIPASPDI